MAIINKTDAQQVLDTQEIAGSSQVKAALPAVNTKLAALLQLWFGRCADASGVVGVTFRLEVSSEPSGDGFWSPVYRHVTDFVAADPEAVSGTAAAGQPTLNVASTTGFAVGQVVFIRNTTPANSEWGRIKSMVANTSITLEDNLLFAQTGSTIRNRAEIPNAIALDLTPIKRLRLVVDGSQFTQLFAVRARLVTGDSIT